MSRSRSDSEHPLERVLEYVDRGPSKCWLWTGGKNQFGYPQVWWENTSRKAHRIIYTELVGPIPDGMTLDHLCRIRACVNPAHLEPVTLYENQVRGHQSRRKKAAA